MEGMWHCDWPGPNTSSLLQFRVNSAQSTWLQSQLGRGQGSCPPVNQGKASGPWAARQQIATVTGIWKPAPWLKILANFSSWTVWLLPSLRHISGAGLLYTKETDFLKQFSRLLWSCYWARVIALWKGIFWHIPHCLFLKKKHIHMRTFYLLLASRIPMIFLRNMFLETVTLWLM